MIRLKAVFVLALSGSLWALEARQATGIHIEAPAIADILGGELLIRIGVTAGADRIVRITVSIDGAPACTLASAPFECRHKVGADARPHVATAVATLASGARVIDTIVIPARVDSVFRSATDAVLVNVSVRDGRGRFVTDLQKRHFRVYENGVPQDVTFFAHQEWACETVLAIDVSGSMHDRIRDVRRASAAFLAAKRPHDSVTLVGFNSAFFVLAPPDASRETQLRAIRGLTPWGGTALFDALIASLDLLKAHDRRRAIVVFTDGEDRSSHATLDRVEQRLATDDVQLYVVGHGSARELPELRKTLDRVARTTGGRAVFLWDVHDAPNAFRDILRELSEQYTIGFVPSAGVDPGWRELRVEVDGGAYRIKARPGYVSRRPANPGS